jgi:nucleotide-binding universal stress UspA family protein
MNKKINRILVCIDFSEYSVMTLGYALEFVKDQDTEIIVLNVIHQRDINGFNSAIGYLPLSVDYHNVENYVKEKKKDRQGRLKQLIKENFFDEKSMMSIKIDVGIPSEYILEIIETENIDLVVMGNKGRGNISRVLFGSTAEKVFRHSPVPVVSVRDRKIFKRSKGYV